MNSKKIVISFAAFFLIIGTLGIVPILQFNNKLLGVFSVSPLQSIMYLVSGLVALWGFSTTTVARIYCVIFGILYLAIAVISFIQGNTFLHLFAVAWPDTILHTIIALVALPVGFSKRQTT